MPTLLRGARDADQQAAFIAVIENVRHGGRPERTGYRITDAGRAELDDWIRELIAEPEPEQPRFMAGLSAARMSRSAINRT